VRLATATLAALAIAVPAAEGATRHGALTFPNDENAEPVSWDYWWGAGNIITTSGHRYMVGMAFTSLEGDMGAGYQLWPMQGPYKGQSVMTMEGPPEWGHPAQPTGRYSYRMTVNAPGTDQRLKLDSVDNQDGGKVISRWERISLARESYRFTLDQAAAKIHPAGQTRRLKMDIRADMRSPLLDGGTGRWFYGVPEDFGYYSRAYQYNQGARRVTGTFELQQPDGSMLRERVDPKRSILFMTRESNPPEAIPVGIGLAVSTQIHARYLQSYNLQWPWELVYADLGNGAQLMFDLQTYHDTPRGAIKLSPKQPTYRVLATLLLPNGESVPLNEKLHAEHLDRRFLPTWRFRVAYRGGVLTAGSGKRVRVPAFDLGLVPPWGKSQPAGDASNNRLTQRVPFDVTGSFGGCPVHGFAWSELLANWYGWEDRDPWFNGGGRLPKTPKRCGANVTQPPWHPTGQLNPPKEQPAPLNLQLEHCTADDSTPRCEYDAHGDGGISATGDPGGWTVTITRPGRAEPIVLGGYGGPQAYPCGVIRRGDHVLTQAKAGSSVTAGNPGICF
jgi:hypothetical protein